MKTLFTLFLSLICLTSMAQNPGVVRGTVQDQEGEMLEFATVLLMNGADSSLVKGGYSNQNGEYILTPIAAGSYFVQVQFTGLNSFQTEKFDLAEGQDYTLPRISLTSTELEEVKITAQKPILTVKPDMTIFNVDASTNAIGTDGLELLRKAPGVVVDNNENIILQGKNGVRVYIDGKPSPLSSEDLANMLKTMQSSQIEAIEIITNPGAKFDAEGNAGIINIRLKKDKNIGANGNIDLGYGIQRFAKYNGSVSANYRNKKLNVFGSLGGNTGIRYTFLNFYRAQNETFYDQDTDLFIDQDNLNGKLGLDLFLSKKSTLGFLANGFFNRNDITSQSNTYIGPEASGDTLSVLQATSLNEDAGNNGNFNVNYRYDDGEGVTWNVDADYGVYNLSKSAFQPNTYYDSNFENILGTSVFTTVAPTDIDIYSLKFDHERPLGKGKLGFGAKASYVITDNDFQFYDRVNNEDTLNLGRSNRFEYTENVNAVYATYSQKINKWGITAGLRAEQTNSIGELTSIQVTGNDTVQRNYLNLFPSGGITYTPNFKHMYRLNYSRRIDRPRYQDLNPFVQQIDELSYRQGNPFLLPQYTHNVELSHIYKYRLTTSVKYSHTTDLMTQITDTIEGSRSFIMTDNLSSQDVVGVFVSLPQSVTKWWTTFTNMGLTYTHNFADYGPGKEIDFGRVTYNVYHQSTFNLPKDFSLEISGFYNSPSIWGANFRTRRFWGVDAGVRKKFLDGRGNIKMAVSDIFYTMQWQGIQEFGGLFFDASGGWESRQFKVSASYLFGKDTVKSARRRKTGLEDESGRVGGGSGNGPGR